jgi:hypothetical protein
VALEKSIVKERLTRGSFAFSYLVEKDGFRLSPPVQSGYFKVHYVKKLPALEKRAGLISSVTVNVGQITAITVNVSDSSFDGTSINKQNTLCIVGIGGSRKVKNVTYTSVNTGTGVFTLSPHTLQSGESVAVGDYITVGEDTYNLCELPDICESYLIQHVVAQTKNGDSSSWAGKIKEEWAENAIALIDSFGRPTADVTSVPITNIDYLGIW